METEHSCISTARFIQKLWVNSEDTFTYIRSLNPRTLLAWVVYSRAAKVELWRFTDQLTGFIVDGMWAIA